MSLKAYLYDKKGLLAGCFGYILLSEAILFLFHSTIEEQVFLTGLFCLLAAAGLFFDFRKRRRFHSQVQKTLDGMQEKYLLMEMISEPDYLEGRLMCQEYMEILKSMNDEIARHERLSNAFKSYIETWIHEIKIPIASAGLMLHNMSAGVGDGASVRRLKEQLHRIEEDVEQVLYYIRGEVPENDYVIAVHPLRSIVEEAVRDQRDSLILHHFSVKVDVDEEEVCTDRKWLSFMLRQMISNAVKYAGADHGMIQFRCQPYRKGAEDTVREGNDSFGEEAGQDFIRLTIEDRGIGISEADLPRIFEKSFTGANGRGTASTGMGLYICRRLCRELGHGIGAESVPGEYTRIWIDFPNLTEL